MEADGSPPDKFLPTVLPYCVVFFDSVDLLTDAAVGTDPASTLDASAAKGPDFDARISRTC